MSNSNDLATQIDAFQKIIIGNIERLDADVRELGKWNREELKDLRNELYKQGKEMERRADWLKRFDSHEAAVNTKFDEFNARLLKIGRDVKSINTPMIGVSEPIPSTGDEAGSPWWWRGQNRQWAIAFVFLVLGMAVMEKDLILNWISKWLSK